jgi:hypothetical protein
MIPTPVHKEARDENQDTDSIAGAGVIAGLTGLALANGSVELARWVLGGRVSDSAVGSTTLRATLGQPVVGVVSSGDVTWGKASGMAEATPQAVMTSTCHSSKGNPQAE